MTETLTSPLILESLPLGTRFQRVAFVAAATVAETVLTELPAPLGRVAIVTGTDPNATPASDELLVLAVPLIDETDPDPLNRVRNWADPPSISGERAGQLLTLQGARVVWNPTRVVVLVAPERLDTVLKAIVEVAYYETELRAIETKLAALWPDLEAVIPLAFEFAERSVRHRRKLAEQFRQVFTLRARLARVTPHVLAPHIHPPTLATQLSERLREHTRMAHRVESLNTQLDVFERLYEGCGQKTSEFMVARTGHALEWIIIILLLAQIILLSIDLLQTVGN